MHYRVITCNLNGIRAAARKGFFAWMDAQDPDVVCLQETKAQEHQLPPEALDLSRFNYAFVDAQKKGYSGVAIYAKRPPAAITRGLGMEDMDAEGRFVRMDFEGGLSIASLYVPSGTRGPARQAVKEYFLDRFIANLAQMKSEGHPFIVCGDYNIAHRDIDVFSVKSCTGVTGFLPQERAWMNDVIDRVGWVDAFRVVAERAQTVHLVVGLERGMGEEPRLAHRLPADHAGPRRAFARRRSIVTSASPITRPSR